MFKTVLAGAALAALIGAAQPAFAASANAHPTSGGTMAASSPVTSAVNDFYAARHDRHLWLDAQGQPTAAALRLLTALDRAQLDGLTSGPAIAGDARALIATAAGVKASARDAERALSTGFVLYTQAVRTPSRQMQFVNAWVAPPSLSPASILATAAAAPSLADHVARIADVNPVYAALRDAAFQSLQAGEQPDARILASLDRARIAPSQDRYVMVDAASARLFMIENGRIADSMKVVVGKPATRTPIVGSTIYNATFNPYWHVPADLARNLIGPRVVAQGVKYLTDHNYEVLSSDYNDAAALDPASVDWNGVVSGTAQVILRQKPNPANSMGQMKFAFQNDYQVYLHDTANKAPFATGNRAISNGCIRLEDAPRFARWLFDGRAMPTASTPELQVALPAPVPVYVTYLTASASDGNIAMADDIYRLDSPTASATMVAGLR